MGDDNDEDSVVDSKQPLRRLIRRASVKAYVESLQPFHLAFQDLSVYVPEEKGYCNCMERGFLWLRQPITNWLTQNYGWAVERKDPYYALSDASGYVQSGEMLLVLTPDTQFSSALIQTLTGRLSDKYSICGSVRVNGKAIPPSRLQGWRSVPMMAPVHPY